MNKILALVILGMGISGAVMTMYIPRMFFETPIGDKTRMIAVISTVIFAVLTIFALKLRRALVDKKE